MKAIMCPCEDITVEEVVDAIDAGYATVEDVKRYTGLATGSCQGRLCIGPCVELLTEKTGRTPDELGTIRYRPPTEPVALGLMAAGATEDGA